MITWIANNKEWLFSGAGITIIMVVFFLLRKLISKDVAQKENGAVTEIRDLSINVEKAGIKHVDRNDYLSQLNLTIMANNGPHTLKRLWIKAKSNRFFDENQGPLYSDKGMLIRQAFPLQEDDLLQMSDEAADHAIQRMETSQFAIRDTAINEGQTVSLTIVDKLLPARMPDGWEDMDLDGWQIIVEYDHNENAAIPFSFLIHKSSNKYCVLWAYTGFTGRILSDSEHDYG